MVREDETLDPLGLSDLQLIQPKNGYRFSMDPFLLCGFSGFSDEKLIYDLGCGNGVIPLLAAARSAGSNVIGLERQPQMVDRALRSVTLNGLENRVRIKQCDLRNPDDYVDLEPADLVLSNPPFRSPHNGRVASDPERAAARHELAGGLDVFVSAASGLLKDGGRFAVVYLPDRLEELLEEVRSKGLEPARMRWVHAQLSSPATMVLVEAVKDGQPGLTVEPPLVVYKDNSREYTEELVAIYR